MLNEINYFELNNNTNIYGSCSFSHRGKVKLIVATRSQVFFVSNEETEDQVIKWECTPILLANIPAESDIISVDCMSEEFESQIFTNPVDDPPRRGSASSVSPILALTVYKPAKVNDQLSGESRAWFNIYGNGAQSSFDDPSMLFSSMDDCQSIPIDFIPFKLCHVKHGKKIKCFILSGSDRMHIYQQNSKTHQFFESNLIDMFPQLIKLPSAVLSFDIRYFHSKCYIAVGCQDGQLILATSGSNMEAETNMFVMDGPVSAVHLFSDQVNSQHCHAQHPALSTLLKRSEQNAPLSIFKDQECIQLAATDAIGYAMLFRDIGNQSLLDRKILPDSDQYDTVSCVMVADIDFDGQNELIIGTFGQQLLIYKQSVRACEKGKKHIEFNLQMRRSFPYPIMSLHLGDFCQDGVDILIVITSQGGVHVLQPDLKIVKQKVLKVMTTIKEIQMLEERIEQEAKKQDMLEAQYFRTARKKVLAVGESSSWEKLMESSIK